MPYSSLRPSAARISTQLCWLSLSCSTCAPLPDAAPADDDSALAGAAVGDGAGAVAANGVIEAMTGACSAGVAAGGGVSLDGLAAASVAAISCGEEELSAESWGPPCNGTLTVETGGSSGVVRARFCS